jgi:metalloendopeptidase OMA1, mitochondrial
MLAINPQKTWAFSTIISLAVLFSGCASMQRKPVPVGTIPEGQPVTNEASNKGRQVRAALLQQFPEDRDPKKYERVSRIVRRLAQAAEGNAVKYPWEITILSGDDVKNAAATSGNFVFVWTGILSAVNDDHELSTVLGHELAHVLALHTEPTFAEQISGVVVSGINIATQSALMSQGVIAQGAAVAGNVSSALVKGLLMNPHSQKTELEADQIGLFLMAKAGYNPKAAINFWTRLSQDADFQSSALSFLSTHPTSERRIEQLTQLLPQAEVFYKNYRRDSFSLTKAPQPVAQTVSTPPSTTPAKSLSNASSTTSTKPDAMPQFKKDLGNVSQLDLWTTREDCPVHAGSDLDSSTITTLSAGTEVIIKHELKDWVEIKSPISGFILKSQVKASWAKR